MSGTGSLNGINNTQAAERARIASVDEEDRQVRSKTEATQLYRETDNFQRRVSQRMPELLVERKEFSAGGGLTVRTVREATVDRREVRAPTSQRPLGTVNPLRARVQDGFYSPTRVGTSYIHPEYPAAQTSPSELLTRSDGFRPRDADYKHTIDALHLIGVDENAGAAPGPADALARYLEGPGKVSLAAASREFLEANAQFNVANGRNEVNAQAVVAQLQNALSPVASLPQTNDVLSAVMTALTILNPVNFGEIASALKVAFPAHDVFDIEGARHATSDLAPTVPEEERLEAERARNTKDFVERIRGKRKRNRKRGSREGTDGGEKR